MNFASGEYCLIVGPDLFIDNDTVAKLNTLLNSGHESYDFRVKLHTHNYKNLIQKIYLFRDNYDFYSIMKTKYYRDVQFDPHLSYGEDREIDIRFNKKYKHLDKVISNDRITFYFAGINSFDDFVKRYTWYGRTSFAYLKKAVISEKISVLISYLAIPLLPLAFIAGLIKFLRCVGRLRKHLNVFELLVAYFLESISVLLFSFGFYEWLYNHLFFKTQS